MILKTVLRTFKHYKLLSLNQTLIIGVSGGTDSLALLHILNELRSELGIILHVATLNHGIRGHRAIADVNFVIEVAERWHIDYTAGYRDVPQLAQELSVGIEEAARIARYRFLAGVAQQIGTNTVAVAHHADDQIETILMHMIRGSGLKGLQGMQVTAPMPDHPLITLIRPLLQVTRSQLEAYCTEHGLTPRHDETNEDTHYQRNYVRQEIVPRLQQLNPNMITSFLQLSESATVDEDFIQSQFEELVLPNVIQEKGRWTIQLTDFQLLHEALQRRYLLHSFQQLSDAFTSLTMRQVEAASGLIVEPQVGTTMDLGGGIRLRIGYERLYIESSSLEIENENYRLIPEQTNIILPLPTLFRQFNLDIKFSEEIESDNSIGSVFLLSNDTSLVLRTRRDGDRFAPKGMQGQSKKVKDWMIDRKIPRQLRQRIPILTANDNIIAICVGEKWHLAEFSQFIVNENRKAYLTLD